MLDIYRKTEIRSNNVDPPSQAQVDAPVREQKNNQTMNNPSI
jgi:hypothetical protein